MNVVLGHNNAQSLGDKYLMLELDTLRVPGLADPITSYALVEQIPIGEMASVKQYQQLHQDLMRNYRSRNWKFCQDAIEHLLGQWNGEIDTFYTDLSQRIQHYQQNDPGLDWDSAIQVGQKPAPSQD